MADLDEARRAKDEVKAALAGATGVTAVGIAPEDDGYGVLVRVSDDAVRARHADLPRSVHGVRVHVRPSGSISAQG